MSKMRNWKILQVKCIQCNLYKVLVFILAQILVHRDALVVVIVDLATIQIVQEVKYVHRVLLEHISHRMKE